MVMRGLGRPRAKNGARDLRADLLRTSRELLDEGGPAALSMREVARRAGCTHQAPYHHFTNRESILAALVMEGFAELAARLRSARALAESDAVAAAVEASANAYVGFALSNPGIFRIMFRPDMCDPARFPGVREAGELAHDELASLTRLAHGHRATVETETVFWAHVHGLASLLIDGPLASELPTMEARIDYAQRVNRICVGPLMTDASRESSHGAR